MSHYFVMNAYSVWTDLVLGFLIAGALGAWVPDDAWAKLFITGHGGVTALWGALIGPLVAMLSFVCSIGNVPLAAVLWRGGISFGGAIAFIFGDLIIIPILNIYRRYYSGRVSLYLFILSYVAIALAGLVIGAIFTALGWVPANRNVAVFATTISWDFNTLLNIATLGLVAVLLVRFLRTGGVSMLREMNAPADLSA